MDGRTKGHVTLTQPNAGDTSLSPANYNIGSEKVKRCVASRKLKRTCIYCDREFNKGDVYYKLREINEEDGEIYVFESLRCPKCHYEHERHLKRFMTFQEKCQHPKEFKETKYHYIPGECVMEPDYDYCTLCDKIL